MVQLQQIGDHLTGGQKRKLARAYRNNEEVTIHLANHALRTFALIVSAHPSAHAISPATSCMSARTK